MGQIASSRTEDMRTQNWNLNLDPKKTSDIQILLLLSQKLGKSNSNFFPCLFEDEQVLSFCKIICPECLFSLETLNKCSPCELRCTFFQTLLIISEKVPSQIFVLNTPLSLCLQINSCLTCEIWKKFQPSVTFHTAISAKQMIGFYIERSNELKWVKFGEIYSANKMYKRYTKIKV